MPERAQPHEKHRPIGRRVVRHQQVRLSDDSREVPVTTTAENRRFILLVADRPDEQAVTMRALRQGGIRNEVVVVHDGDEAIEFTEGTGRYADRNIGRLPSLILLDMVSPYVEGHKALQKLRGRVKTRLIPTVVLMPGCENPDHERSFIPGANSQVLKPMDARKSAEMLGQVARYWLQINETAH